MIRTYWLTFRLHDDADYERRYDALYALIQSVRAGKAWDEPTSFIMFQSALEPAALVARVSNVIDEIVDFVVLAHVGFKEMHVIGATDHVADLKRMVPYLK